MSYVTEDVKKRRCQNNLKGPSNVISFLSVVGQKREQGPEKLPGQKLKNNRAEKKKKSQRKMDKIFNVEIR